MSASETVFKFYMQRIDTSDESPVKDLEKDFPGLHYISCEGLSDKGKPKNYYTEEYADSDELRVYVPDKVCRESTKITLTLLFNGKGRRDAYDSFYIYVSTGKFHYWDTARKRMATVILDSAVELDEDFFKGGDPYLTVEFKFTNVFGDTEAVSDEDGGTE